MRTLLFAACAIFVAAFCVDPEILSLETRRLVFKCDPRFYGSEVYAVLWLAVVWTIADLTTRVLVNKRGGNARARLNPYVRNAVSATLYLLAILILGHIQRWNYEPFLRSLFQPEGYSAPGIKEYIAGERIFETNARGTVGYGVLGLLCVAWFAYASAFAIVDDVRETLIRRRKGTNDNGAKRRRSTWRSVLKAPFARLWTALAFVPICFDASFCVVSFVKWVVFHYYYLPAAQFVSFHEITQDGAIALGVLALGVVGIAAFARRARRVRQ